MPITVWQLQYVTSGLFHEMSINYSISESDRFRLDKYSSDILNLKYCFVRLFYFATSTKCTYNIHNATVYYQT
jgi:hypothetical protein